MLAAFVIGLAFGILVGLLIARIRSASAPGAQTSPTGGLAGRSGARPARIEVQRRIETKLTPEGMTITVNGETFHRLEDIPDPAVAAQVRQLLVTLPSSVEDPTARATIEDELHDAGIDPDQRPGSSG